MRTFNLYASPAICQELSSRCKRLRLQRNLTQSQLAIMTNASLSSIRRFETNGQVSLELFIKIVQALNAIHEFDSLLLVEATSIDNLEQQTKPARKRARKA